MADDMWSKAALDYLEAFRLFIEDETGYAPFTTKSEELVDHYLIKVEKKPKQQTVRDECERMLDIPDLQKGTLYVKTVDESLVHYNLTASLLNLFNAGIITKEEVREMMGF